MDIFQSKTCRGNLQSAHPSSSKSLWDQTIRRLDQGEQGYNCDHNDNMDVIQSNCFDWYDQCSKVKFYMVMTAEIWLNALTYIRPLLDLLAVEAVARGRRLAVNSHQHQLWISFSTSRPLTWDVKVLKLKYQCKQHKFLHLIGWTLERGFHQIDVISLERVENV